MPKRAHEALERQARKKGMTGEQKDRYVYGALRKVEKAQKKKR